MADGSVLLPSMAGKRKVVGFAGGGGSSEAIRLALNCDPDVAMNHWMTAVLAHQRHFPNTEHYCADIFDVDARNVLPGERIAFGWFSPDCTDFSKAKGKAPRSERIRGLAWSVIPWALFRRIDVIMLENVEEFAQWGPVYRDGPKAGEPIPERRGETFRRWKSRLEKLGYVVEWRVLNAADYGAPTTRKRLYLVARCDGNPIVWPERTHAPRSEAAALGLTPWRGACEIIDWSQSCPSIFLTPDEVEDLRRTTGRRVQRPLVKATLKRVARGMERYVIGSAEPFIVPTTHGGDARAHDVRDPLRTITSVAGGEFAVVGPTIANIVKFQQNSNFTDPRDPLHTVMAGAPRHGLTTAHVVRQFGTGIAHDVRDPDGSATAEGIKSQLVTAYMAQGNGDQLGRDAAEPISTLTGRATQQQLIAASLDSYYSSGSVGATPAEPMRTSTGKARHSLIAAWLEQANTDMVGHELPAPVSTIVGKGCTQRLIEARLELDGGAVGRRSAVLEFLWSHFGVPTAEEWSAPSATLAARLKFGIVILPAATSASFGGDLAGEVGEAVAASSDRSACGCEYGSTSPDAQAWLIVDIGLRMLTPAELAAAMGLPADFDLTVDAHGEPISKTAQTQMIGNMVSPPPAAALICANCPDLIEPQEQPRRAA